MACVPISPLKEPGPRPFWSVMIPCYNAPEQYLAETLRSVLAQDPGCDQMQITVVDDCSPNGGPLELVKRVAGDRVTVVRGEKNLGLAGIWNRCIELTRGEWVHILHQDDLVFDGFYECLRRGVEAHPQVGAAFCRHAYCDGNSHWKRLSVLEMPAAGVLPDFVEPLVTGYHIQCAAMVVKRSTYEKIGGFNPTLQHALDWEMWIRIANQYPIFYEPKILAAWREHDGATTSRQIKTGENIRDIARAIGIWSKYIPEKQQERLSGLALQRFAEEGLWMAKQLLKRGEREAGRNQIAAALSCKRSLRLHLKVAKIYAQAWAHLRRNGSVD